MSEFTSYYRSIGSARESSSAVEYGHVFDLQTRTADFLDALDARVRALEDKPDGEWWVTKEAMDAAVLAERERCAKVAEKATLHGACKMCRAIAAEIRRGA